MLGVGQHDVVDEARLLVKVVVYDDVPMAFLVASIVVGVVASQVVVSDFAFKIEGGVGVHIRYFCRHSPLSASPPWHRCRIRCRLFAGG